MKYAIYDGGVLVGVIRNGNALEVPFKGIKEGDTVCDSGYQFHVAADAHLSGDADYPGWLLEDVSGNAYFPEDFGANLVQAADADSADEAVGDEDIPLYWDDLTPAAQKRLCDAWGSNLNYDVPGVPLCWLPAGGAQ